MQTTHDKKDRVKFPIAITMAGAASAGAYTAGVMDYLFEILKLWEDAKEKKLPANWDPEMLKHIPGHDVIIEAMGGTSAGGMTTMMAAIYGLNGVSEPVTDPKNIEQQKDNLFYKSWVLMAETEKASVLQQILSTEDLDDGKKKIRSLLNSSFIDNICKQAFDSSIEKAEKFPFIADDLELVLSHTMLRGMPLAVDFTTPKGRLGKKSPVHATYEHQVVSHFKLNHADLEGEDKDNFISLDPVNNRETMMLATMATGAFPVGLRFREFLKDEFSTPYLKHIMRYLSFNRLGDTKAEDIPELDTEHFPDPFHFVSIDGGAINNEPFGEVLAVLKNKYGKIEKGEDYKYAMIMIDPFPDVPSNEPYKQPDDLFSVVPAIIGTLWDQAKVKRGELLDAYSSDYYRGEIFPVRWHKKYDENPNPIACGAAMAFSGLLDKQFRHYDFFLGRHNARNFFRTYFSFEYPADIAIHIKTSGHPIHKNWTPEMVQFFKKPGDKIKNTIFLPIIPDLHFLQEKMRGINRNPYELAVKDFPIFDPETLFAQRGNMKKRVLKMMELSLHKAMSKDENKVKSEDKPAIAQTPELAPALNIAKLKNEYPLTEKWMQKYYRDNAWTFITGKIGNFALYILYLLNRGKIANRVTKAAMKWILKDLEAVGLLREKPVLKKTTFTKNNV